MKYILAYILGMLPFCASADGTLVNGIYYLLKGNDAIVTSGTDYSGNIVIPEKIEYENIEYNVTNIGFAAFAGCSSLTSITISDGVTSIGSSAFARCSSLASVVIPNSVTDIGNDAFADCGSLTSITIPNGVTNISDCVFQNCSSLTSVTIPNGVTNIGDVAFAWCNSLTSITIPNSVAQIGSSAFVGCSALTSITIPNSVTKISSGTFSSCSSLASITIPNSVTQIYGGAFEGCSSLTSITIPNSVTQIEGGAFAGCMSLTSIIIPNSIANIGDFVFADCSSLVSITIPSSVISIGSFAFGNCQNLESVYCHASGVPLIATDAFDNSYAAYATLYVPEEAVSDYKKADVWKSFGQIKPLTPGTSETKICSLPAISYSNGHISFVCETEGVEFVSEITNDDIKMHYDSEISLGVTYNISVYATKSGYINSETAHATLCWIDAEPKQTGTTDNVQQIPSNPVLVKSACGSIIVEGASTDYIEFYNLSGKYLGSENVENGRATFNTEEEFVIVRIGDRSIKIKR